MAQIIQHVVVNPDTMPGDADLSFALRPPTGYGGITIIGAWVATGAVGTFDVVLQNYGAAGTVAGGTVAGMADGTATVWAADTPQALTLTAAQVFLDEGEYMVVKKVESAAGNDTTADASVHIDYVLGMVSQA